jgi:hypothetical protein
MKINILGHSYEIIFVEDKDLPDDSGRINFLTGELWLKKSNPLDVSRETLSHEIIEAINWWGDLQLNHHQICILGTFLWGIIQENPEIKEYLWE